MAGAAIVDITPPTGLCMAGFGIRTAPAQAVHDALTARALVIGDTALLVVDVIGLDDQTTGRIRKMCCLPDSNVIVAASHTHGGPHTMPDRLGGRVDRSYLARLERRCVEALDLAASRRREAVMLSGGSRLGGVAVNRRHAGGPVDANLPVLRVEGRDGTPIAMLFSYACHPVVLDATNLAWTADYPHFARAAVGRACPGAVAIFATGCAGDANTGHSAESSLSLRMHASRSFEAAARIGDGLAEHVLGASLRPAGSATVAAAETRLHLQFERRERGDPAAMAAGWRAEMAQADPALAPIYAAWLQWADRAPPDPIAPLQVRVSALRWGDALLLGMPGEIFATTAHEIRARVPDAAFVLAYCDDNPGYIAPAEEYRHGGYEIAEAHRYYAMPATFARGSAEAVRDAVLACAAEIGDAPG